MGKILNIELDEGIYQKVVGESKKLDRSIRKTVSILIERGLGSQNTTQPYNMPQVMAQLAALIGQTQGQTVREPLERPQREQDKIENLKNEKEEKLNEMRRQHGEEMQKCIDKYGLQDYERIQELKDRHSKLEKELEEQLDNELENILNN